MIHLIHWLIAIVLHNQNQFAQGGIVLMAIGTIGAALRKIPEKVWNWIVNQTTMKMTIVDESEAFTWLKYWYQGLEHCQTSRRIDVFAPHGKGSARFTPAPGKHWFFYKGRPLVLIFERSDQKKQDSYTAKRSESFILKTIGRDQQFFRNLIAEVNGSFVKKHKDSPQLHYWSKDNYWETVTGYTPRTLDSVILPEAQKSRIIADIERFKESREWYQSMGIPYHRGYVLFGPPGTGKTSLVTGLSEKFRNRVYLLKLNEHTDSSLAGAVSRCAANSFIVLEDVDCVIDKRMEKGEKKEDEVSKLFGVSLSGLLNVIDGLESPSGVMFFMTTNYIEKLDSALLRPGRVDVKEFIAPALPEQIVTLHKRFFPEDNEAQVLAFVTAHAEQTRTMAEIQEELMQERNRRLGESNGSNV